MILCLDMDAFFASVEQAGNPALRGKPVGVIGSQERTVVVTCSYEARKFGVKTGMSKFEALRLCPHLILVPGRSRKYTYISKEITKFLKTITPMVEVYSIDEAFLDISDKKCSPSDIAYMIKSFVKKRFNITCSVGVGANKLLAKMATGVNKPDGYYIVEPGKEIEFIDKFKLGKIWGIGRKLSKKFSDIAVFTPKDMRELGEERLVKMLGVNGSKLFQMAHGLYPSGVEVDVTPVKSIGHSMTMPKNIYTRESAAEYVLQLSEMVSARARKNKYAGKTISMTVRFGDFSNISKMKTTPYFTSATHHIYETAMLIFDELWDRKEPIRLIGVSLSKLVENYVALSNTEDNGKGWEKIYETIDDIKGKFGDFALSFASELKCDRRGTRQISPAWRPKGARDVNVL